MFYFLFNFKSIPLIYFSTLFLLLLYILYFLSYLIQNGLNITFKILLSFFFTLLLFSFYPPFYSNTFKPIPLYLSLCFSFSLLFFLSAFLYTFFPPIPKLSLTVLPTITLLLSIQYRKTYFFLFIFLLRILSFLSYFCFLSCLIKNRFNIILKS